MDTRSYWSATHTFPAFPAIKRDIEVDVVVVGAGLTGITTAYLLKQAGARCAARTGPDRRCDTSRTTAHLTYCHGCASPPTRRYLRSTPPRRFGRPALPRSTKSPRLRARPMPTVASLDAGLSACPARDQEGTARQGLEHDAELARAFGFDATFMEQVPGVQRPGCGSRIRPRFIH